MRKCPASIAVLEEQVLLLLSFSPPSFYISFTCLSILFYVVTLQVTALCKVSTCPWGAREERLQCVLSRFLENVSFTRVWIFRRARGLYGAEACAQTGSSSKATRMPRGPRSVLLLPSTSKPWREAGVVSRWLPWLQTRRGRRGSPGPHLVRVVEAVVHEPCDQRRLPDCKTTRRKGFS